MFSYEYYKRMVGVLLSHGYEITDYHTKTPEKKQVILRHDVDFDLEKAVHFAEFEKELGVRSTYFVLLTSHFYNLFSKQERLYVEEILSCGHKIGLHFDETQYGIDGDKAAFEQAVKREIEVIESLFGEKPDSVSMHRPSKFALEMEFDFGEDVVNSYSDTFFREYKYISDSRMRWREDVVKVIEEEKNIKLHLLTHPIWYNNPELDLKKVLSDFFARKENKLYEDFGQNFSNSYELLKEVRKNI